MIVPDQKNHNGVKDTDRKLESHIRVGGYDGWDQAFKRMTLMQTGVPIQVCVKE